MSFISYDMDPTEIFYTAEAGKIDEAHIDSFLIPLKNSQVRRFFFSPAASTAFVPLKHWELFAEKFDPAQGAGQHALNGCPGFYALGANLYRLLHEKQIDLAAYLLEKVRQYRIEGWISMRMNDIHDGDNEHSPLHCSLWRNHPEWRISSIPYNNGFDYSYPDVRRLFQQRGLELIEHYALDGFQADFTRFPLFFSPGSGQEKANLITNMIRRFRRAIDKKSHQTGRKIRLGVRVPGLPSVAHTIGLDVSRWCQEKLIDDLVVAPFLTLDTGLPVAEWKKITGNDITLSYGLEIITAPSPAAKRKFIQEEGMRGVAAYAIDQGAHGIYLFNFFKPILSLYPQMLKELADVALLQRKSRQYHAVWHDVCLSPSEYDRLLRLPNVRREWNRKPPDQGGEDPAFPLRLVTGKSISCGIYCGPPPSMENSCILDLYWRQRNAAPPEVRVNGESAEFLGTLCDHLRYAVSPQHLCRGRNHVRIHSVSGRIAIENMSLRIS